MSETFVHMQSWSLPFATVTIIAELVYLRGWLSLRRTFPDLIGGWRLAAFTTGLVSVWIAGGSPLATLDHRSLTIHMIKHLLVMTVAAPLILAGEPTFPLVCGLPKLLIKNQSPLANVPAAWLERCLRHPRFCWLAGTAAVIGWHLPVAFQSSMRFHPSSACSLR